MKIETFSTGRVYDVPQVLEFINDLAGEITYLRDNSRGLAYAYRNFGFSMSGPEVLHAYDNNQYDPSIWECVVQEKFETVTNGMHCGKPLTGAYTA